MFVNRSFVRNRNRRPPTLALQGLLLTLFIGVSVLGIGAYVHLSSGKSEASSTPDENDLSNTIQILIPVQDIDVGVSLEPSLFRRDRRPKEGVSPEMVKDVEEIQGLYSKGLLVANQPVYRDYLTTLQPVNKLTASIPVGHRAIAIAVDAISSVEGWAQAGARVDVLWTANSTLRGEKLIVPVAQNAKVLSANRQTEASNGSAADPGVKRDQATKDKKEAPSTVTLLMTTKDSLKTRLSSLNGRLSLVLRGTTDSGRSAGWGSMTDGGLWGAKANQKVPLRNITRVQVKDPKSGKEESILFENGQRILD